MSRKEEVFIGFKVDGEIKYVMVEVRYADDGSIEYGMTKPSDENAVDKAYDAVGLLILGLDRYCEEKHDMTEKIRKAIGLDNLEWGD